MQTVAAQADCVMTLIQYADEVKRLLKEADHSAMIASWELPIIEKAHRMGVKCGSCRNWIVEDRQDGKREIKCLS